MKRSPFKAFYVDTPVREDGVVDQSARPKRREPFFTPLGPYILLGIALSMTTWTLARVYVAEPLVDAWLSKPKFAATAPVPPGNYSWTLEHGLQRLPDDAPAQPGH